MVEQPDADAEVIAEEAVTAGRFQAVSQHRVPPDMVDIDRDADIWRIDRLADIQRILYRHQAGPIAAEHRVERLKRQVHAAIFSIGCQPCYPFGEALKQRDVDCFLLAGRYTLLEQDSLNDFLPLCEERGAAVVVGGGFNSGILAAGAVEGANGNDAPAPAEIMEKVKKIEAVCAKHDVPLPAAALQFVVAHPAIPSFIAGTRTVEQLEKNLAWFDRPIPTAFWTDLKAKGLLREDAPIP